MSMNTLISDSIAVNNTPAHFIEMPERFTLSEANNIESHVHEMSTKTAHSEQIVLDFGNTTFMDHDGLLGLCRLFSHSQACGIKIGFDRFSPQIQIILSLTGLDQVFARETVQLA